MKQGATQEKKSSNQGFEELRDSDIPSLSISCQLTLGTSWCLCQLVLMSFGDTELGYFQMSWYHVVKVFEQSLRQAFEVHITVVLGN